MDWRARGVGIRVGGHRGSPVRAPENTWASFECAQQDGVAYIETDIRRTADGTLVLMHDETIDRTTSGSGKVDGISAADLAQLDAGAWFGDGFRAQRVPSLADFIGWIEARPPLGAALEVKGIGTGAEVARRAWASPARDRFAIYSFHPDEIRAAKLSAPQVPCVLLLRLTDDPDGGDGRHRRLRRRRCRRALAMGRARAPRSRCASEACCWEEAPPAAPMPPSGSSTCASTSSTPTGRRS